MPDRPNILLITTDQQRGDCIGIDEQSPSMLMTPNLDYLAASGSRFRRGYAECPSCIPARRSLLTGTAPAANGMVGFRSNTDWIPAHTLPGELTKAGYQTELIGKLHLHPPRKRYGYERMQRSDSTRPMDANDYADWLVTEHNRHERHPGTAHGISSNGWVGRASHLPEEQTHTFWCVDRAIDFLDKRDPTAPYFLHVSFVDPHPPLTPPAMYYQRYVNQQLPKPVVGDWAPPLEGPCKGLNPNAYEVWLDDHAMHAARAAYYGMINFIDDQIGRLLSAGVDGNTFIVFTSDHGEMLGDHHLFRKTFAYEASARVPFVMRAPRPWKLGPIVSDGPVGLQDIMPTLLDAAGVDVPETCTGRSLLPIMRGETSRVRDVLHGEHAACYHADHAHHFLVDDACKYIWHSRTGIEQFFDLCEDPQETCDLAHKSDSETRLAPWRARMIDVLKNRPEGFTDGKQLIAGREHGKLIPNYDADAHYPYI